jgi:hypothetical protein
MCFHIFAGIGLLFEYNYITKRNHHILLLNTCSSIYLMFSLLLDESFKLIISALCGFYSNVFCPIRFLNNQYFFYMFAEMLLV